jgi:hypothetical protein
LSTNYELEELDSLIVFVTMDELLKYSNGTVEGDQECTSYDETEE